MAKQTLQHIPAPSAFNYHQNGALKIAIETVARDFTDARLFVVGINDPQTHCLHPSDYLGFAQSFDGPRYIIVGPAVSDEKLERNISDLSSRFGVTLAQLQAVRDRQADMSEAQPA